MTKIVEITDRDPALIDGLSSVQATHHFLSEDEILHIQEYVPQALQEVPHLIIMENKDQIPIGFMSIANQHLEMLFIANAERRKGYGKKLLQYGIEHFFCKRSGRQ